MGGTIWQKGQRVLTAHTRTGTHWSCVNCRSIGVNASANGDYLCFQQQKNNTVCTDGTCNSDTFILFKYSQCSEHNSSILITEQHVKSDSMLYSFVPRHCKSTSSSAVWHSICCFMLHFIASRFRRFLSGPGYIDLLKNFSVYFQDYEYSTSSLEPRRILDELQYMPYSSEETVSTSPLMKPRVTSKPNTNSRLTKVMFGN